MTLPFPPPGGLKFLKNTYKSSRTNTRAIPCKLHSLIQAEPDSRQFFRKITLFFNFPISVPIPGENGGRAPEKLPAHTAPRPPPRAGSTSAAKAGATPLLPPARTSLETRPLLGLAAPAARPATPRDRGDRRAGGRPTSPVRAGAAVTHRGHLQGAAAPAFPGRGWPGPQRGGQGPRFQPKAGRRAGRKGQAGRAAAGPSPRSETPTPFFPPGLRPPPRTRPREPGSPRAGARRTPAAAQPARCARSSGGPGEGRTRRPGQGERAAPSTRRRRGRLRASGLGPNFATGELRFARGARGGCRWPRPAAAAGAGAPGSPLQRREGVEPSGRVSRGRNEGAVPAQPPAGTPGYARRIFAALIPGPALKHMPPRQSVSAPGEHFRATSGLVLFSCCKGAGFCRLPKHLLQGSLCKTSNPGFFTEALRLGSCKIPSNLRQPLLYTIIHVGLQPH